jgi:hypothetical protein
MTIAKQLCINRFRLPLELLDIIKEYSFYDIVSYKAKKCMDKICRMINEGNTYNEQPASQLPRIMFYDKPKIVRDITKSDRMMHLQTFEKITETFYKCRIFSLWFCKVCGDYEKTSFENEYGNIFIDEFEFSGCICDKDLRIITRRTLFPLGKIVE